MMGAAKILRADSNLVKREVVDCDNNFPNRGCSDSLDGSDLKRKECKPPMMSIFEALSEDLDLSLTETSDPPCKKAKIDLLSSPGISEATPSVGFFSAESSLVCSPELDSEKTGTELEKTPDAGKDKDVVTNKDDNETKSLAITSSVCSEKQQGIDQNEKVTSDVNGVSPPPVDSKADETNCGEAATTLEGEDVTDQQLDSKKEESQSTCDQKKGESDGAEKEEKESSYQDCSSAIVEEGMEKTTESFQELPDTEKPGDAIANSSSEDDTTESAVLTIDETGENSAINSETSTLIEPVASDEPKSSNVSSAVSEVSDVTNGITEDRTDEVPVSDESQEQNSNAEKSSSKSCETPEVEKRVEQDVVNDAESESLVSSMVSETEPPSTTTATEVSEPEKSLSSESSSQVSLSTKPSSPGPQFPMYNDIPDWYGVENFDPERRKQVEKIVDLVATDFVNTAAYRYLDKRLNHENSELIDNLLSANGLRDDYMDEIGFLDYDPSVGRSNYDDVMTDETMRELMEPDGDLSARNPFSVWAPDELDNLEPAPPTPVQDVSNALRAKSLSKVPITTSTTTDSSEALGLWQTVPRTQVPPASISPIQAHNPAQLPTTMQSNERGGRVSIDCHLVENSTVAFVTSNETIVSALPQVFNQSSRCDEASIPTVSTQVPQTLSTIAIKSEPLNPAPQETTSLVATTNSSTLQPIQQNTTAVQNEQSAPQVVEKTIVTSSVQEPDSRDLDSLGRHCTELIKFSMRQYRQSWLRKGATGCQRIEHDQLDSQVTSRFASLLSALEKKLHRQTTDFGCQVTVTPSMDIPPNRSTHEIPVCTRSVVSSEGRPNQNCQVSYPRNAAAVSSSQNGISQSQRQAEQPIGSVAGRSTPVASQTCAYTASPLPHPEAHSRPPSDPGHNPPSHTGTPVNSSGVNYTPVGNQPVALILRSPSVGASTPPPPVVNGRGRPPRFVDSHRNEPKRLPVLGVRPKTTCATVTAVITAANTSSPATHSNVQVNTNHLTPPSANNSSYLVVPINASASQSISSPMYQLVTPTYSNPGTPPVDRNNLQNQGANGLNQRQIPDNSVLYKDRSSSIVQSPRRVEPSFNQVNNNTLRNCESSSVNVIQKQSSISNQNQAVPFANQNRAILLPNQNQATSSFSQHLSNSMANQNQAVPTTNQNQAVPPTNQNHVIDLVSDDDDDSETNLSNSSNLSSQRFLPQNNSHLLLNPSNNYRNALEKQKQQRRKRGRMNNRADVLLPVTTEIEKMSNSIEAAIHDLPPKLLLSASPTESNNNQNNTGSSRGITLIWKMSVPKATNCRIKKYELMANTGLNTNSSDGGSSSGSGWVLVDSIAPLVLPMQCSLTNLNPGVIHFAIRGVDVFKRAGDYSNVVTVSNPKPVAATK